jgi:hypothetical protein
MGETAQMNFREGVSKSNVVEERPMIPDWA